MEKEKLFNQIEEMRGRLNELCKNINDKNYKDIILSTSMEMDKLINEYVKFQNNNNRN